MNDAGAESAVTDVYEDARAALEKGFIRADQLVYNFAMDYDMSPEDAWRLIEQEASSRGDDAVRYLCANPLDGRSYKLKNAQRQAGRFAGKGMDQLSDWFRRRGGR